ncbi:MAG: SMI1/KNR4 family protein [Anaerofustis sp.]
MEYDFIKENAKNAFYAVTSDEIEEAQNSLDLLLPNQLKEFYLQVGYGFISGSEDNVNRIMDPLSVRNFRLRQNDYEYYPDIEIYDKYEDEKVIFFESDIYSLISIGIGQLNDGVIYYYDVPIAKSLKDFLIKLEENDTYFVDMMNE